MSAFYDFGLILAFCDAKIKIPEIMKLKTSLKSNFYLKNIKLKNYQIHNLINAPFLTFTINLNQHKFPSIWNSRNRSNYLFLIFTIVLIINSNMCWSQIAQRGTATSNSQTSTSTTTFTISKPTGVVTGDVMIVNISQYCNNSGASDATLTGWTKIASCQPGTNTSSKGTLLYRIVDGSEGSSFTFNIDKPNYTVGAIIAFSGVDISGGVGVGGSGTGPFASSTGSFNTSIQSASSITTTSSSAVLMFGMCTYNGRTYNNWTTATSPGALTELYDVINGSNWASVGAAWSNANVVGSTGIGSVTLSNTSATYWGGILVA